MKEKIDSYEMRLKECMARICFRKGLTEEETQELLERNGTSPEDVEDILTFYDRILNDEIEANSDPAPVNGNEVS